MLPCFLLFLFIKYSTILHKKDNRAMNLDYFIILSKIRTGFKFVRTGLWLNV